MDCKVDNVDEVKVACVEKVVCAGVVVVRNKVELVLKVEVDVVDCPAAAAEFPFPAFGAAAPASVVEDREIVLELVDVVETPDRVMAMLLPAGAVTFRRTFVHRRPLNVVTEDDIRMAAV